MTDRYARSSADHEAARQRLPGGVNSPVRACKAVGGTPFFAARGRGPRIVDVDGNAYVDYVGAYGPLVLGHADPRVVGAVQRALENGLAFGAPTEGETELAELVATLVPGMQKLRLVNSGTEATMSALRVARGVTGRDKIVKFDGCYHGHADSLLVKAGSGALTFGSPDSAGVTPGAAADTLVADYNDLAGVARLFEANPGTIAAVIVEPVPGNMGVVLPQPGFLQGLGDVCARNGALLIFDEVMSGFRVALGGAQARFGVTPDLTCLGKVIGGGLPIGAYGGRADLMARVAPDGPIYQAGTLSGNPLSVAAGLATLRGLAEPGAFEALEATTTALCDGLARVAAEVGVPVTIERCGSMFTVYFTETPAIRSLGDVRTCDFAAFATYFHAMRDNGVSLPPSQYEACFVSTAHDDVAVAATLAASRVAFEAVARGR